MKTRAISYVIMLGALIPVLLIGGTLFTIIVMLIAGFALNEVYNIRATKKSIPVPIKVLSYIMLYLFILYASMQSSLILSLDLRHIAAFGVVFLLPLLIYQEQKTYTINDAAFVVFWTVFIGGVVGLFVILRNIHLAQIVYLLLVALSVDTFAYAGKYIGKHKLMPHISPKKTIEGTIYGCFMATVLGTAFYSVVIDPSASLWLVGAMTLLLSICCVLGDLIFSAVKRYYSKKDFSNLIPGHGGILDRIDGLIFVVLVYVIVVTALL